MKSETLLLIVTFTISSLIVTWSNAYGQECPGGVCNVNVCVPAGFPVASLQPFCDSGSVGGNVFTEHERIITKEDGKKYKQVYIVPVRHAGQGRQECPSGECPTQGLGGGVGGGSQAQQWAQREAQMLANGASGHPMGCCPGSSFSGTGWTSNRNCPASQIPSCKPNRNMQLIAEGVVRNSRGSFVSRHWAN